MQGFRHHARQILLRGLLLLLVVAELSVLELEHHKHILINVLQQVFLACLLPLRLIEFMLVSDQAVKVALPLEVRHQEEIDDSVVDERFVRPRSTGLVKDRSA